MAPAHAKIIEYVTMGVVAKSSADRGFPVRPFFAHRNGDHTSKEIRAVGTARVPRGRRREAARSSGIQAERLVLTAR